MASLTAFEIIERMVQLLREEVNGTLIKPKEWLALYAEGKKWLKQNPEE